MNAPLKFVAEIAPVREVSLIGSAELRFWRDLLRRENLCPAELDGEAQILVCGTDAKFKGIPFRELSISVFVSGPSRAAPQGAFLAQAFNSNWFFALIERTWFSTPYDHALIEVDPLVPASIRVRQGHKSAFFAAMVEREGSERRAIRCGNEGWEGPIFLPGRRGMPGQKCFFGRIGGLTHVYPFYADRDELSIGPNPRQPALTWLAQSGFAGRQWILRDSAVHARSKTYVRDALEALRPVPSAVAAAEA